MVKHTLKNPFLSVLLLCILVISAYLLLVNDSYTRATYANKISSILRRRLEVDSDNNDTQWYYDNCKPRPRGFAQEEMPINDPLLSEVIRAGMRDMPQPAVQRCLRTRPIALCVFSEPRDFARRNAIRETWGNASLESNDNFTLWFIIGKPSALQILDDGLKNESSRFGDVVLGNFVDSERNETIKLLYAFFFVITQCPFVEEIYFGRDTTYVNVHQLMRKLYLPPGDGAAIWRGSVTHREISATKSECTSRTNCTEDLIVPVCSLRNGFMISSSLGKHIICSSGNEPLVPLAEVFLGKILRNTSVEIVNDKSFAFKSSEQVCEVRRTMTTFTSDYERYWKQLVDYKLLRQCYQPAAEVVFSQKVDNRPYLGEVLSYINNNETICSPLDSQSEGPFILALISSNAETAAQRLAIRETWASQQLVQGRDLRFVFILGKSGGNSSAETQEAINIESETYGDIVQGNFQENFRNLTLKVILGLKWAEEFCPGAAYLYKGDEDMFVSWVRLINLLLRGSRNAGTDVVERLFIGRRWIGGRRITNPKNRYYVSKNDYPATHYTAYLSGGSYVMSMDIVPLLYKRALITPLIPIDDAYQGILAADIGVHAIHYIGFRVDGITLRVKCQLQNLITLHGFKSPKRMRHVWQRYITNKKCV